MRLCLMALEDVGTYIERPPSCDVYDHNEGGLLILCAVTSEAERKRPLDIMYNLHSKSSV